MQLADVDGHLKEVGFGGLLADKTLAVLRMKSAIFCSREFQLCDY